MAAHCGDCHVGERFGFSSLQRAGASFTPEESAANYETFLALVSIDAPQQSRLLAKLLPEDAPESLQHAGGPQIDIDDPLYTLLLDWIDVEKAERCPDCGLQAPTQWLAYVEAPNVYWALDRAPTRSDRGVRDGQARILMQAIDPDTFQPTGDPIDFLDGQLCPEDGRCDFGHLSVNHAGTQMVFECRLPVEEDDDWISDTTWNLCIADISADGTAVDPRFLMPPERRHRGRYISRGSPYGLYTEAGLPLKGVYDHPQTDDDITPIFSPDDQRIYFASRGPNPRTGRLATRTYRFQFVNNIVSVATDGSDPRVTYVNDGGTADFPTFLHDGHLAIHVWNLERMDKRTFEPHRMAKWRPHSLGAKGEYGAKPINWPMVLWWA